MEQLQTLVSFLLALGILVTFHEFGHFWVARRCGIKVLRFSIGFGKPFYSWYDKQGTEFALAAIPLGGYVKMLDEREGEVPAELLDQAFTRKSVWARIAVVAAGPVANFLLAILLFWALVMPGTTEVAPVVAEVQPGSVAAQAGLEPGQEIVAIDGVPTPGWQALNQRLLVRLGESGPIHFTVKYPDSDYRYESDAELRDWLAGVEEPDVVAGIGITLFRPTLLPKVAEVTQGMPAQAAGIRAGDLILAADGEPMPDFQAFAQYVRARPEQAIELTLERELGAGAAVERLTLWVTPARVQQDGAAIGQVGISPAQPEWPPEYLRHRDYNLLQGLWRGAEKTWDTSGFVLLSLKKLLLGEISTKNLSGPITIAKVAGASAKAGWEYYVGFLALLSVSLGVFNLLPVPVLDGGHLLYFLIEVVKGSPVSERVQMLGFQVGLLLVLGVMLLAIYNDLMRL